MKKKALITGINGQDGSYLAEFLLKKGYEVHGIIKKESFEDDKLENIKKILKKLYLHKGNLTDQESVQKIVKKILPDECYHLASLSYVNYTLEEEFEIIANNFNSTHYLLSSVNKLNKKCKFFFAGSSEMFGEPVETPQNENTPFNPKTIYGISKVSSFFLVKNYREKEKLFACSGILYNHESVRRSNKFVTKKIIDTAVKIKMNLKNELILGNLNAQRDWGYAPDYVEAMWKILQHNIADDYIISTGKNYTIEDFLEIVFSYLELDYKKFIKIDKNFYRESEKIPLRGDFSKIKNILKWENKKCLKEIIIEMINDEMNKYKQDNNYV